jgi:selenocysteine lyase/cysteine desulfurase
MLDAIFLSPHKLPGGLGASGVLVVRKEVIRTAWQNISSAPLYATVAAIPFTLGHIAERSFGLLLEFTSFAFW